MKSSLDRSVYRGIKRPNDQNNVPCSAGAELLKRTLKLCNLSLTKIVPIKFVHSCVTASLSRYVNSCFLLSVLIFGTLFHFLPLFIDSKALECDARNETDNKWAHLRILNRYTTVQ